MARFLQNRDGGKIDEEGLYRHLDKLFPGEVIVGLNATQQDTPGLGVEVQLGSAMIPSGDSYPYVAFMDAAEDVTLATADGSNPRIDLIVGYIDLTVVSSTNPNNPNAFKLENVTGAPAGSPTAPNAAAIQAVIGASNPYVILAQVAVAAAAATITNANITDVRDFAQVGASNIGDGAVTPASLQSGAGTSWTPQSFTPAFSNFTIGSGTVTGDYIQIGKRIIGEVRIVFGTSMAFGTVMTLTLPVAAATKYATSRYVPIGSIVFVDSGTAIYHGLLMLEQSSTAAQVRYQVSSGTNGTMSSTTSSTPMTLATGDAITMTFSYDRA